MNMTTLVRDVKALIEAETGYSEHNPRSSRETTQGALPNTGIYRLVVMGTGKTKLQGLGRYADLILVLVRPLSGGDANKSNLESAIETEELITELADYAGDDTCVSEEIESQIIRENGRQVSTLSFQIAYKLS